MNDSESRSPIARLATPRGAILFDCLRAAQADAAWLRPAHWLGAEEDAARGGRGAVWFVHGDFGAGVLRHYRRGGLMARINGDRYLWQDEESTRSFREFRLLTTLRARGLPVPAPLVAGYRRYGLYYRADLLTALIPRAQTLAQRLQAGAPVPANWGAIGATIARFHAQGAYHADLNAHNIMLDDAGAVWLIDFDRGELRAAQPAWQQDNLARLQRSLRKLGAEKRDGWGQAWGTLTEAYHQQLGQGFAA